MKSCIQCQDNLKTELELTCLKCHRMLPSAAFSRTDNLCVDNRQCNACTRSEHETRLCQICCKKKNCWAFSKIEWRNNESRQCRACVNKTKENKPKSGHWKCCGQCGGRTLPKQEFSWSGCEYTGKQRCNACVQKHGKEIREQANQCMSEVMKPSQMPAQNSKEHTQEKHKEEEEGIFESNVKVVHQWKREHHGKFPSKTSKMQKKDFWQIFYIDKGTNCASRNCQKIV